MKLNIGENIRKYRKQMEMTQEQLAEQLGTSVQSVSRWESGGGYPDMELLPELARVFGVSVNELFESAEQNLTEEKMRKQFVALCREENPPAEKIAEQLRRIRMMLPKDAPAIAGFLFNIHPKKIGYSSEILQELRLILELSEKQGDTANTNRLLRTLAKYENEDHFRILLHERFNVEMAEPLNSTVLRMDRAEAKRDMEQYRMSRQLLWGEYLRLLLQHREMSFAEYRPDGQYNCDDLSQTDIMYAASCSERKLQLLHAFNGVQAEEKYPLSGNGAEDMWTPERVKIGLRYAAQLAALGKQEQALTVLEDMAGLIEQSCTFPAGTSVSEAGFYANQYPHVAVLSPLMPDTVAYKKPMPMPTSVLYMYKIPANDGQRISGMVRPGIDINVLTGKAAVPTDSFRSSWLDPIRDHPRYKAVVERIEACRDRLKSP